MMTIGSVLYGTYEEYDHHPLHDAVKGQRKVLDDTETTANETY